MIEKRRKKKIKGNKKNERKLKIIIESEREIRIKNAHKVIFNVISLKSENKEREEKRDLFKKREI